MMRKDKQLSTEITEIKEEDPLPESDHHEQNPVDPEDADCVVNVITPPDGDPDGRLQQILELLRQQETSLKKSCEEKIELDNQAAEEIRERFLNRMNALPSEFLDSPVTETVLTQLQIPGPVNLPSCCLTKNSISRRVIRVISKDVSAAQSELL
eukprot:g3280.t1